MLSPDTQVVMLLTAVLPDRTGDATPVGPAEFARLMRWLSGKQQTPSMLLSSEVRAQLQDEAAEHQLNVERLHKLLDRGMSVAVAAEKWLGMSLWIASVCDQEYPQRLKERLQDRSTPLLYGVGKSGLLSGGGIAVVGSRNADAAALDFAKRIGELCAREGITVISGGAKGVDLAAMHGALEAGGSAIGVLASQLARETTSSDARAYIADGKLALVSPYSPEAPFSAGNAMGRNKYIYAIADYSIVVSSDADSGGTWSGAIENLAQKWCPLFVREAPDTPDGNRKLVRKGGIPLSSNHIETSQTFLDYLSLQMTSDNGPAQTSLFS